MNVFTQASRIIVTCNNRLAPFLEKEILELGFNPQRTFKTGVELYGTTSDCVKLNMNLRCASQVLYSLRELKIHDPDELYKKTTAFPWEKLIPSDGYVSVTSNVTHPTINNELFVNVKVKDAIVDRIRQETARRPDSGSALDQTVIHLYWKDTDAEIFLDTSGETLAKHGYRKIPGKAPMLEALAAATLMATKWDRSTPFINPMCGSGTVAIEAVLLATNRRPGLFRSNYSFMHILNFDENIYKLELNKLKGQISDVYGLKVVASDVSGDAIKVSMANARAAGVEKYISFDKCDFELTDVPEEEEGVIFFNPEYGERLGDAQLLEKTYSRIGDFMKKKCKGYTGYVFTGNLDLAKKIGLKPSRRIEFYSAKLDCRLLEFELYEGTRK
ncbi:MAG TPA: class I SAM-dependent RNA methyltransferase [Cyclobacteriaceae bacterium]|nr:class I SAM-dependent RNA methyltransferase [Cyclobacteriaceae bacterium]